MNVSGLSTPLKSRNNLSMMKKTLAVTLLGLGHLSAADLPYAEITNGQIQAKINLPDAKDGYYRATRFDPRRWPTHPRAMRTPIARPCG
jgi:hypothetical protein